MVPPKNKKPPSPPRKIPKLKALVLTPRNIIIHLKLFFLLFSYRVRAIIFLGLFFLDSKKYGFLIKILSCTEIKQHYHNDKISKVDPLFTDL
jgi:hypothetical protein